MKTILGKKIGMTQVFAGDSLVPVTVVEVGPCVVTQIKTEKKEGYGAVQIGFGDVKDKHLTKPLKGHFEKAKTKPSRYLVEYRLAEGEEAPQTGTELTCSVFEAGDLTNVVAVSKGKGFQGVMKRHGFSGGPGGHGSHFHRAPGSIGMAATPSRVFKGMRMAGQMGNAQVTIKNLEIVKIDTEQNIILLKGAVPGGKGALLVIKDSGKKAKNPIKLLEEQKSSRVGSPNTPEAEEKEEKQAPKIEEKKEEKKVEEQVAEEAAKPEEAKEVKAEEEKVESEKLKSESDKKAEEKVEETPKVEEKPETEEEKKAEEKPAEEDKGK